LADGIFPRKVDVDIRPPPDVLLVEEVVEKDIIPVERIKEEVVEDEVKPVVKDEIVVPEKIIPEKIDLIEDEEIIKEELKLEPVEVPDKELIKREIVEDKGRSDDCISRNRKSIVTIYITNLKRNSTMILHINSS